MTSQTMTSACITNESREFSVDCFDVCTSRRRAVDDVTTQPTGRTDPLDGAEGE